MSFASSAIRFFSQLEKPSPLPKGIEVMNPYEDAEVMKCMSTFFKKFYSDNKKRVFILGINPGRFGAGITGIPFTDPIRLRDELGIENDFPQVKEFSAEFIYRIMHEYGGAKKFYSHFYINSICPLGFTKNGRNYNYYDDPKLVRSLDGYLADKIWKQIDFGAYRKNVVCLGTGTNYRFFSRLNGEHKFFEAIHPIEHPRFILQYRKRYIDDYVKKYTDLLAELSS